MARRQCGFVFVCVERSDPGSESNRFQISMGLRLSVSTRLELVPIVVWDWVSVLVLFTFVPVPGVSGTVSRLVLELDLIWY